MKVSSSRLNVQGDPHKAYARMSNFSELGGMMPAQVQDWKATEDTCSFDVGGMARISMRIAQKVEPSLVVVSSDEGTPFGFTLAFHFQPEGSGFVSQVEAEIDVNMVMGAMIKGKMQTFVDTLNQHIKTYCEQ